MPEETARLKVSSQEPPRTASLPAVIWNLMLSLERQGTPQPILLGGGFAGKEEAPAFLRPAGQAAPWMCFIGVR